MKSSDLYNKAEKLEWLKWLLFAGIAAIFVMVSLQTEGYDDEFYNIRYVRELNLVDLVKYMQSYDLHPPLSYVLNYLIYNLLGSWPFTRVFSSLFFLISLFFYIKNQDNTKQKLIGLLLIGFNPTILLWVTGLRWYAYTVPLIILLSILPSPSKWYYWGKYFFLIIIISYLGYAGLFLALPYFIYYWIHDTNELKLKWRRIWPWAVVTMILYAYQFYIFITVHSKVNLAEKANQQVFDLKTSLISFVASIASNQGVFPLSLWGVCSIVGSVLFYGVLIYYYRSTKNATNWIVFISLSFIFLVTGIAGKVRNLVLLEPARNKLFANAFLLKNKIVLVAFILLISGNVAGIYNIVTHQRTTKNAWNIPVLPTMEKLFLLEQNGVTEVYFTHHPSFDYYLMSSGKKVISFYNSLYFDTTNIHIDLERLKRLPDFSRKNFTFILTYRGRSIEQEHYNAMRDAISKMKCDSVQHFFYNEDDEYKLKQHFFKDYPRFQTEVYKLYNVQPDYNKLKSWEVNKLAGAVEN